MSLVVEPHFFICAKICSLLRKIKSKLLFFVQQDIHKWKCGSISRYIHIQLISILCYKQQPRLLFQTTNKFPCTPRKKVQQQKTPNEENVCVRLTRDIILFLLTAYVTASALTVKLSSYKDQCLVIFGRGHAAFQCKSRKIITTTNDKSANLKSASLDHSRTLSPVCMSK